jgi:hypothetical protein
LPNRRWAVPALPGGARCPNPRVGTPDPVLREALQQPNVRIAVACAALLALAAVVRAAFVGAMELPHSDPWRHLLLIQNIRAGRGFTLFAGQPYIWYSPVWYHVAASLAAPEAATWVAAAFSALAAPLFALYLYRLGGGDVAAAWAGGIPMAAFGPLVTFTSQLGAEAFALFLLVAALLASVSGRGPASALGAGLLFGLSLSARLQFLFNGFLFLPLFRSARRGACFGLGAALPLALHWWRNRSVIQAHPFVFSWDGLATRSSDYDLVSTLIVQLHPSVAEATRLLYERTVVLPEWLYGGGRVRWEMLLFLATALVCVVASKRLMLILTGLATLGYFWFLDETLSSRFFRIWLGVFPALFTAIALVTSRLASAPGRGRRALAALLVLAITLTGVGDLRPRPMVPLEAATPPEALLSETHYMVNSGYYHPESLLYRYPDRHFIGMPLEPEHFDAFRAQFPAYRSILWHGYNVQRELLDQLRASRRYRVVRKQENAAGYAYRLWQER